MEPGVGVGPADQRLAGARDVLGRASDPARRGPGRRSRARSEPGSPGRTGRRPTGRARSSSSAARGAGTGRPRRCRRVARRQPGPRPSDQASLVPPVSCCDVGPCCTFGSSVAAKPDPPDDLATPRVERDLVRRPGRRAALRTASGRARPRGPPRSRRGSGRTRAPVVRSRRRVGVDSTASRRPDPSTTTVAGTGTGMDTSARTGSSGSSGTSRDAWISTRVIRHRPRIRMRAR